MSTTPPMDRKLRLLCLHGFTQSGPLFRAKTRALEKNLQKAFPTAPKPGYLPSFPGGVEFVHLTAPIRLVKADLPFSSGRTIEGADVEADDEGAFAWWRRDETGKPRGDEVSACLGYVGGVMRTEGPFDGVLGFSQGAALAGMLAGLVERGSAVGDVPEELKGEQANGLANPPFKLAVCYSGYRMPDLYDRFYEGGLNTPTLHFIGSVDTVVEEKSSLRLVEACRAGKADGQGMHRLVYHPGGHFVPASQKPSVNALVQFIRDTLGEEQKKDVVEEKVEDMDMPF